MDKIQLATPEEVEAIAHKSDLTTASSVVTYGGKDFAVLRQCWEIDPVFFHPESGSTRKVMFLFGLETALRLQGVKEYYFNVPANDAKYIELLEKMGAAPTSREPELRFKKVL